MKVCFFSSFAVSENTAAILWTVIMPAISLLYGFRIVSGHFKKLFFNFENKFCLFSFLMGLAMKPCCRGKNFQVDRVFISNPNIFAEKTRLLGSLTEKLNGQHSSWKFEGLYLGKDSRNFQKTTESKSTQIQILQKFWKLKIQKKIVLLRQEF